MNEIATYTTLDELIAREIAPLIDGEGFSCTAADIADALYDDGLILWHEHSEDDITWIGRSGYAIVATADEFWEIVRDCDEAENK